MRRAVHVCILLAGILAATVAAAHGPPAPQQVQATLHDPNECYCRAQGRLVAEGDSICLRTPAGGRMAECRMETNVMSWGITETPCPDS